jgi:hypothetical protein
MNENDMPAQKRAGPWKAPPYDPANAFAMQALAKGSASAAQQQLAFNFIVKELCETERLTFWPPEQGHDGTRATDFAEGKRWVGLEIRRLLLPVPEQFLKRGEDGTSL